MNKKSSAIKLGVPKGSLQDSTIDLFAHALQVFARGLAQRAFRGVLRRNEKWDRRVSGSRGLRPLHAREFLVYRLQPLPRVGRP